MKNFVDILSYILGVDTKKISKSSLIVDDLNADSLDQVEIIIHVEDEYDLEIPDEDAEKIKTVGEAVDYLSKRGVAAEHLCIAG